jgi:hypothetical protein
LTITQLRTAAVTDGNIIVHYTESGFGLKVLDTAGQPTALDFEEDFRDVDCFCFWCDQMAVVTSVGSTKKLSVWDVKNPSRLTCLKRRVYGDDFSSPNEFSRMKMSAQFIVILEVWPRNKPGIVIFYFISTKTLEKKGQLEIALETDAEEDDFVHDQGLLFVFCLRHLNCSLSGFIEIHDVPSGSIIRNISTKIRPDSCMNFLNLKRYMGINSKFLVVSEGDCDEHKTKLKIFDLEAVRNPGSNEDSLLIRTIELDSPLGSMAMDETQIVYSTPDGIRIMDFFSKPRRYFEHEFAGEMWDRRGWDEL